MFGWGPGDSASAERTFERVERAGGVARVETRPAEVCSTVARTKLMPAGLPYSSPGRS
jgi:hypothetical protein